VPLSFFNSTNEINEVRRFQEKSRDFKPQPAVNPGPISK
jgi:hypothetical protein